MTDCTFCGCEVEAHDPVAVYERAEDESGDREAADREAGDGRGHLGTDGGVLAGEFCNWGCLAAYVDESDVTAGTACNWSPDG